MLGSVTLKNVSQTEAPSVRDASSSSRPISSRTGTTSRIVNGMQMKIVTNTIAGSAKMIWIPRAAKNGANHPPGPNSTTAAKPTVTGDSANGMSTTAFSSERPWNRCRTSTHATMTPNRVVMTTVTTVTIAVSWNAWRTSGSVSVCVTLDRPARTTVQKIAMSGSNNNSATHAIAAA